MLVSSETISYSGVDGGNGPSPNGGGALINVVVSVVVSVLFWILFAFMIYRWMKIGERK
jgi:hypothetical protein